MFRSLLSTIRRQPRAALPFSFFILLGILQSLKVLEDRPEEISETFTALKSLAPKINETVPLEVNPAKSLALKIQGRLPVIYGAGITAEVAHRWKTQINENTKTTAFYEVFSELNHNSIMGYSFPEELVHQTMVVMLDSDLLHERIRLRYGITQQVLDQAGIYYQVLKGEGSRALSQMMTLVLFGRLCQLLSGDSEPDKPHCHPRHRFFERLSLEEVIQTLSTGHWEATVQ